MTVEEYFGDWSKVINTSEAQRILKKLALSNKFICPLPHDVFKAFRLCSLKNLKVLVLAQDPYNNLKSNKPVATGIAFANSYGTPISSYSPSLEVLRESVIDFTLPHQAINFDPSLEKWEEQGVLLVNASLTCEVNKPESHALLWRPFMKSFLTNLSEHTTGIVYVLMGNAAQSFEDCINAKTNHIIKTKHPSWYARTKTKMPSDIWRNINKILIGQNGYGIEWYNKIKN
jgi:uracil-DNA glycosylase